MFPQTYGTHYYGKRLPVAVEKQLSTEGEGLAFVEHKSIFAITTACETITTFGSKIVGKKLVAPAEGIITAKKFVRFSFFAVCEAAVAIAKHMFLPPITTVCESAAAIKKQAQKVFSAAVLGLASMRKFKQVDFEFIGPFVPGDVIKIDSRTLEVTINGSNALHLVGKDNFPTVRPGEQELVYADKEGNRMVRIRIQWKDRWL